MWQKLFYGIFALITLLVLGMSWFMPIHLYLFIFIIPLFILGVIDTFSKNNVLYNYPLIGHLRYLMEFISPEIRQYFLEDDKSGRPYNREQRTLIKDRAHGGVGKHPFGTVQDIRSQGYHFVLHSMRVCVVPEAAARIMIGGPQCTAPYLSSRLNISAMSFGALSAHAVLAMNQGAFLGGFSQDTGEGGLTRYHLGYQADLVWEIASAYFGCRTPEGRFDDGVFAQKAALSVVKMIAIKLSQGAKPGHGGLLPGSKVTPEISEYRGVPVGQDCLSPAVHPEFDTPTGLLAFVARVRRLASGKPVGFKLCIGRKSDFLAICKAMLETGIYPDFITVDGSEGGTGAASLEFSDYIGMSLDDALPFVHASLTGIGLRDKIRIIASGKIVDGFDMACKIAIGADLCNVARPMMFAVGCIQAMRCHTGTCPTGVTSQDPKRFRSIDIPFRALHVKNYHHATVQSFLHVVGAMGLTHPDQLQAHMIWRRMANQDVKNYAELYPYLAPGALLGSDIPAAFSDDWHTARADSYS